MIYAHTRTHTHTHTHTHTLLLNYMHMCLLTQGSTKVIKEWWSQLYNTVCERWLTKGTTNEQTKSVTVGNSIQMNTPNQ